MSAIDKLLNTTGYNDYSPGRHREYHGFYHAPSRHYYFPPTDPTNEHAVLFCVDNCTAPKRTAESIGRDAAAVEEARSSGRSLVYQTALSKNSGIKGHSPLFTPSEAMRLAYPHLSHLWSIGPAAAPWDVMHLLLQNVAPHLWRLFAGLVPVEGEADEDYVMPKSRVALIGREIAIARRTVPRAQARSLRNIDLYHRSYKAVDWMYWLLSSAEVILVGRIPDLHYDLFMSLCRACRLLLRPAGLTPAELTAVDRDLKRFIRGYYASIYRGRWERLPLCRFVIAALLDIVENMRACGPAWVSWQFPAERKIGELGGLIPSRSKTGESLSTAVHWRHQAELVSSFGSSYLPMMLAEATGKHPLALDENPKGSVVMRADAKWDAVLLPPRCAPAELGGVGLASKREAVAFEVEEPAPPSILAQKYFCFRLMVDGTAGLRPVGSDCTRHRRHNYLLRIRSSERVRQPDGSEVASVTAIYAAVMHYAVVFVDGRSMAFAYVARARSARDRRGRYGYATTRHDIQCITGSDGERYYVPVDALEGMVGTLERDGVHFMSYNREPYSGDS